ncbi:hypothetical protein GIW81_13545 [Hyphomicrobium sp. xq]|uniref:Uncharacterized protein n=1 Tax=Hyphomicrobium album TaxID=2665159 RepID=A0A6I3KLW4_9HYPH|nr:ABZJ_00895 family protein [Hyphomicrobium album]MTD95358.1 hypothetical protein [Hyphomicrobium album]
MTSTPTSGEANLWPALITFSIAYMIVSAMVTAVLVYLDLNSNTGVSVAILIAATAAAAQKFVAGHGRALSRREQLRFALLATAASMLLSIVQMAVILPIYFSAAELPQLADETRAWVAANVGLVAFIAIFVVGVFFAVLYFASGGFSRMFAKRLATGEPT